MCFAQAVNTIERVKATRSFVALAAVLTLAACAGGPAAATPAAPAAHPRPPASAAAAAPAGTPEPAVATKAVSMSGDAYHPAVITVKVGDAVTWTQQDRDPHDVLMTDPAGLRSPILVKGETYTHTFTAPGSYSYICSVHPYMRGKVIVTA